jgi:hypothetical protein
MVSPTVPARAWCLTKYRRKREEGLRPHAAMTSVLRLARESDPYERSALGQFRIFYAMRYRKIIGQRALNSPCWDLGWENS